MMMNKELERLLRLNKDMDEIIAKAKVETDKMKTAVEEIMFNSVKALLDTLEDIRPVMDVICSSLRTNEYQEKIIFSKKQDGYWRHVILYYGNPGNTNYGIKIRHDDTVTYIRNKEFWVSSASSKFYDKNVVRAKTKEFIVEHFDDIIDELNTKVENLLLETMGNKARKQVELQRELQDKLNKFGVKE